MTHKPRFVFPAYDSDIMLKCPICDSLALHQRSYRLVIRREDDDALALDFDAIEKPYIHVPDTYSPDYVEPESIETIPAESHKLLGRRQELLIFFECESCSPHDPYIMSIYQHKGCTHLCWHTY